MKHNITFHDNFKSIKLKYLGQKTGEKKTIFEIYSSSKIYQ